MVILGFTEVYIIFSYFLIKNIEAEAVLTSTHNQCF